MHARSTALLRLARLCVVAAGLSIAAGPVSGRSQELLVPMDRGQANHLRAYGLTYWTLDQGASAEWLLNYRAGSFLLPDNTAIRREAALLGVTVEPVSSAAVQQIRATIAESNMEAVILEKAPRVAVYTPPNSTPWDDAVTIALTYAGIPYEKIWDSEVLAGDLSRYDWLHLHHEDFTGQYSKFYLSYAGAAWLEEEVARNTEMARSQGYPNVPALKTAVTQAIRSYVEGGGLLFAMCSASETIELTLAASLGVDIAAAFSDGSPADAQASEKMDWSQAMAFADARVEVNPGISSFSDIDGHQVNTPWRAPLGGFSLFGFSAKFDPVPTMLTQNHESVINDFYGLTTSFRRDRLQPGTLVLGEERGAPWVKYIHGTFGAGTFTFFGGHDPEDPEHKIGDPPTDLDLHPNSPGYRLILNNVLFPAAKKKTLKT